MTNDSIAARVAALQTMSAEELKALWHKVYDTAPPPFNIPYLRSRLAYRLQELVYGGLTDVTRLRLERLAAGKDANPPPENPDQLLPGTWLVREWKGVEYRVMVMESGYSFQDCLYPSLSAVANRITGSKWNGPMFFGLKGTGRGRKKKWGAAANAGK